MNFYKFLLISISFASGIFVFANHADAAQLLLYPDPLEIPEGSTGILEVRLDTEGQTINAAEAVFSFPAGSLIIHEVLEGGSVLPLWPERPFLGVDSVKISGGAPAGFSGSGIFARMVVSFQQGTLQRTATISFDEQSRVLLNDGFGTAASLKTRPAEIRMVREGDVVLSSPSHSDESQWYQQRTVVMHWEKTENTRYSYQVSRDPYAQPDSVPDEPVGDIKLELLDDGIYYFSLCALVSREENAFECKKNGDGVARISRFRVMIDGTAPQPFEVAVLKSKDVYEGDFWFAAFAPSDAMSGIFKIEVAEVRGGREPQWVQAANPYALQDQSRNSELRVRAVDYAGNIEEIISAPPSPSGLRWWAYALAAFVLVITIFFVQKFRKRKTTVEV